MTVRERVREVGRRLSDGFLADPTHVSLGFLCLVVAYSLFAARDAVAPLPPFLMLGWAAGLTLAGVGKVVGPYLTLRPRHEDTGRGVLLSSSILAAVCWGTIAVGTLGLGSGATLAFLQSVALALGAVGRTVSLLKSTKTVDRHTRSEEALA